MTGLLVAGTSSDAGKSLMVTGLCRVAQRRGIDVVPFKAQNMSNNSMVCADGSEIGRAQYLQALASRVEPSSAMNPVLLKPGSDRTSFIVLRGQPHGELRSGEYTTTRAELAECAWASYEELATAHELVICEGAGSPAEINLRRGDYTNMGLARRFNLPVVLVGDIDRGGTLAAIYGTWGLLDEEDRALLAGYVINKFRGDESILRPGLEEVSRRTGLANFGVMPWLSDVWLDGEDSLSLSTGAPQETGNGVLRVAAVRLPRVSNATDVDALAQEPGVVATWTTSPAEVEMADLVVLPGSRTTLSDLAWLHSTGIAAAVRGRAERGLPVLGICGGYQMLTRWIEDGLESGASGEGLGLLPARVRFEVEKCLDRPRGEWAGQPVTGYRIHHGRVRADDDAAGVGALPFLDGLQLGPVWGTMWHGSMESDGFRREFLRQVARASGARWQPVPGASGFTERREAMIDRVADALEQWVDVDGLLALAR